MEFNESDLGFLSLCLRVAEDTFNDHAGTSGDDRIRTQFERQAAEAAELRKRIEADEESACPTK